MPIVTSRPRRRWPSAPMTAPADIVKASNPTIGAAPTRTAPVAPANPMCESAWAAKESPRRTTKYPITPAESATIVPASNACCMKAYRNSSCTTRTRSQPKYGAAAGYSSGIVMRAFRLETHDEHVAVIVVEHLDRRVVEPAQLFGGDDLGRLADGESAMRDVEHAIDDRQQGVDVVRDEQHGEPVRPRQLRDQLGNDDLVAQVEAGQRLVEEQHLPLAGERLGQEQPLLPPP